MQQQSLIPKKKIEHYIYSMSEQIGKGYSSKVYKGKDELTGETVAIKVIDMKAITNDVEKQLVFQEINALKLIQSVNVIKLYDFYNTNNNTYIITEYCNNGDLGHLIQMQGYIQEIEAFKILRHIINGFKEQIKKGVIHRDIKPANILIKNSIPKIADYGFSKMSKTKEKVYYRVGTPVYMSPESFLENRYSEKSDIWSIGVLYYEMLYGKCPWVINKESEFQESTSQLHFNRNIAVSEESKDFLRRILEVDENLRMGIAEIEQHPLFLRRNTINIKRNALPSNSFNRSITNNTIPIMNHSIPYLATGSTLSPEKKDVQNLQDLYKKKPDNQQLSHKHQRSVRIEKVGLVIPHQGGQASESSAEDAVLNLINQCKFIYRTCQLLEHTHPNSKLKNRQISKFGRDSNEILQKLRECYERGVNTLKIINFNSSQIQNLLNKYQFKELYQKQREYFSRFIDNGDSCLRELIRELNHQLRLKDGSEAGILLLDYLVYYYQVCEQKMACQFSDGKPLEITAQHFQELRVKIFNLCI